MVCFTFEKITKTLRVIKLFMCLSFKPKNIKNEKNPKFLWHSSLKFITRNRSEKSVKLSTKYPKLIF